MTTKSYPYTDPLNYTFDPAKIIVESGLALLRDDVSHVYARYHMNESLGTNVPDSSGNSRNGTTDHDPLWVLGMLNNCLNFNGVNQRVNCGDIAAFERNDPFSVECWFRTTTPSVDVIIDRYDLSRGWSVYIDGGQIVVALVHASLNGIKKRSVNTYNSGAWHHLVVTYDGTSMAHGVLIYVDGQVVSMSTDTDNLTDTIIRATDCCIASRNLILYYEGDLDEVLIYDEEINQTNVLFRYNLGIGRESWYYFTDKPTIEPTNLFDPLEAPSWDSFLETLGMGNEGSIGYNLYKVDKLEKYYWNGVAWVIGGDISHYNSHAVMSAHISTFDPVPDKIGFIAYLISDSFQAVELDENQITYTTEFPPFVNSGADKECYDHEMGICPFSDALISDPDGDIENASAWRKIEASVWTQIPKGGYGTLQEAIRSFQHLFDNLGDIECHLKIIDEQGHPNEDFMVTIVKKYLVSFNIKDTDTNHLGNILCNFDDGQGWQSKNSPFTYEFEYKSLGYFCTFDKTCFVSQTVNVPSTIHTENITLQRLTVDPGAIADAVWDEETSQHVSIGSFGEEVQTHATPNEVRTKCDKSLISYDSPTKSEMDIKIDGLNDPSVDEIVDQVWDEDRTDHVLIDSFGYKNQKECPSEDVNDYKADMCFLNDIEGGRWKIFNNQMIFYKPDNVTVIATFDLFDWEGKPTETDVKERKRA